MSLEQLALDRLNQKCDEDYTDLSYLEEYCKIVALYRTVEERKVTGNRNTNYTFEDELKMLNDDIIKYIAAERLEKKADMSCSDLLYLDEYAKIVALYKTEVERRKTGTSDIDYDENQILVALDNDSISHLIASRLKQKADPSNSDLSYLDEYYKIHELFTLEIERIKEKNLNSNDNSHDPNHIK